MMRKSLLFISLMVIPFIIASCDNGDTIYRGETGTAPQVAVQLVESPDADKAEVKFTPNSETAKYEFAIGTESQRNDFINGSLNTETISGNAQSTYTFDGLTGDTEYMVFARGYDSDGNAGGTTSLLFSTFIDDISVYPQFIGDISMAMAIELPDNYSILQYFLTTDPNDLELQADEIENNNLVEEPVKPAYATYFDLEPDTDYYFCFRAMDRFGKWTKIFTQQVKTAEENSVPRVDITTSHNDIWLTKYNIVPNDLAINYALAIFPENVPGILFGGVTFNGNYVDYMEYLLATDAIRLMRDVILDEPFDTAQREPGFVTAMLVMTFDERSQPANVMRYDFAKPANNPDAGVAEVNVSIVPTSTGAIYTFEPNDATLGFFADTFETQWIEATGLEGAEFREYYFEIFGYELNRYWHRYFPPRWNLTWEDDSLEENDSRSLTLMIFPYNENGVEGWGNITRRDFTALN